jgi:hypothetical protein
MAENEGGSAAAQNFVADLTGILHELGPSLALLYSVFWLPFLEGQRALLRSYQKALEDPSFRHVEAEHVRALAKVLMASYLDLSRSQRENCEHLVATRSNLIKTYLEALDKVLSRREERKG